MSAGDMIALAALSRLLPMHLLIDAAGDVLSCGPTLRKLVGRADHVDEIFRLRHANGGRPTSAQIAILAGRGERLDLSLSRPGGGTLRGEAEAVGHGRILLNLGFGPGLIAAIAAHNLTDGDFSATDLAIEMLYLHEANRALIEALSRQYRTLDQAHDRARNEALTDPLTGLLNRRGLMQEAAQGDGLALMVMDLDHFKEVNDRMGHAAGDEVLRHVARILRAELRAQDRAARTGGDEFVILLRDDPADTAIASLARRIMSRLATPFDYRGTPCRIGASIGAARSPPAGADMDELMQQADAALYAAKRAGRGRFRVAGDG